MTDLASASAAPSTIKIGGEVYTISPLTIAEFGEYEQWMRDVYKQRVLTDPVLKTLADADRQSVLAHIFDQAQQISYFITPFDFSVPGKLSQSIAGSFDGVARLLWMGIHKSHPDVTVEQVCDGLGDKASVDALMEQFADLNFGALPAKKKTRTRRKATTKKRAKVSR